MKIKWLLKVSKLIRILTFSQTEYLNSYLYLLNISVYKYINENFIYTNGGVMFSLVSGLNKLVSYSTVCRRGSLQILEDLLETRYCSDSKKLSVEQSFKYYIENMEGIRWKGSRMVSNKERKLAFEAQHRSTLPSWNTGHGHPNH